jgi:flagellar hook-length control protein FliK
MSSIRSIGSGRSVEVSPTSGEGSQSDAAQPDAGFSTALNQATASAAPAAKDAADSGAGSADSSDGQATETAAASGAGKPAAHAPAGRRRGTAAASDRATVAADPTAADAGPRDGSIPALAIQDSNPSVDGPPAAAAGAGSKVDAARAQGEKKRIAPAATAPSAAAQLVAATPVAQTVASSAAEPTNPVETPASIGASSAALEAASGQGAAATPAGSGAAATSPQFAGIAADAVAPALGLVNAAGASPALASAVAVSSGVPAAIDPGAISPPHASDSGDAAHAQSDPAPDSVSGLAASPLPAAVDAAAASALLAVTQLSSGQFASGAVAGLPGTGSAPVAAAARAQTGDPNSGIGVVLGDGVATPAPVAGGSAAAAVPAPIDLPAGIARQVMLMAAGGGHEAVLRLQPPELGDLTVRVVVEGRDVSTWFGSPQPAVQQAINLAIGQLRSDLGGAGYNLTGAWVGADASGPRDRSGNPAASPDRRGAAAQPVAQAPSYQQSSAGSTVSIYV